MKATKKIIAVFLTILTILSILSTATSVFAAEYVENKARNEYFDSTLSGYLKSIVDVDGAVDIAEKEKVEDAVNEVQNSAVSNVRTFSLRSASVQSEASSKTVEEAVEDLDIDHSRLTLELEDGKSVAYLFSEPVSFIDDNGELVYKDTNIKTVTDSAYLNRGYTFENGNNDYKTYFSTDSEKGVLIVLKDGNEIRLVPSGEKSVGNSVKLNNDGEQLDAFSYQNVYGAGTLLRFLPQLNGIKDEIVLDRYNGKSDFEFTLHTGDHTAAINSKGEIEIINSKREIVQTFAVPFAYDAQGNEGDTREHYTDCAYSLEEVSDGIYNLTVNVPEEFLTSEDTVFPVTVDPTTGNVMVTNDSAVYSAEADEGHGANHTACFGKTSNSQYGKGRAMFFFRVPTDIKSYAKITEAKLWLRETTGRTETMYVRPYLNKDAWPSTVTWNTQPDHYSTFTYPGKTGLTLGRRNINSTSTDNASVPYWYAFNITNAVRAWTTGTNNKGLKFIAECEAADGDYLWRAFATKEHSTSAYHPYAVITYTNDTTPPTFSVSGNPTEWTNKNVTLIVDATDDVYGKAGVAAYSFDNGSTWKASNLTPFSANQTVYIRVKDKAGNVSDAKKVIISKIDKTTPVVSAPTKSPTSEWSKTDVTVTNNATDALSGIADSNGYSFDGGSTWQTAKTKKYTNEGTYTITPKAKDKATNQGTGTAISVKIDKTAPVVSSPTKSPNTEWSNTDVIVTNRATDALSGIAVTNGYSFDGGSTWQTAKTKTYTDEGEYTVTPKAKDKATNQGTGTAISVKIDKTAPTATITGVVNGDIVNVTVTASDALSGLDTLAYSFDGGSTWQTSAEAALSVNETHTIIVRDKAGNTTTIIYNPTAGAVAASPSLDTWTNKNVTLTASGIDISQYNFDSGAWSSTETSKSYPENTSATVGFKDSSDSIITYINVAITNIDKDLPVISDLTISKTDWTKENVTITVTASDVLSGLNTFAYSFDGGKNWQESNIYTLSENTSDIIVAVRDKVGNISYYQEIDGVAGYCANIEDATKINVTNIDKDNPTTPNVYEENGILYISAPTLNEAGGSPEHFMYRIGDDEQDDYIEIEDKMLELEVVRTYDVPVYAYVEDEAGNTRQETSFILESTLGEYTASYTDITLGEGLFPVPFARTYSSNDGWFFTFEANVQPFTNGYVFTDFYGEKQYFIQNGEGKYLSVDEDELTVNLDENEAVISYVLSYGGMTCTFDSDGRLTNIKTDYLDTDYTWGENSLTIDGGAVITFENGKPKNITVTRTDNQGTSYSKSVGYNWSNSDLMVFTDVMGTSHNYDYTNGLLTNNEGELVTYSAEGRVKLVSQQNGAFVKYTYNDNAWGNDNTNKIGAVTVSDSKGVTDIWQYVDGILITNKISNYSDSAVYDPENITDEPTADVISDVAYIATIGIDNAQNEEQPFYEIIGEKYIFYDYDDFGRVVSIAKVPRKNIENITEILYFPQAERLATIKSTIEYVSADNERIKEQVTYKRNSENQFVFSYKDIYLYYDNGDIQCFKKLNWEDSEWKLVTENDYDENGNMILQIDITRSDIVKEERTAFSYDDQNRITSILTTKRINDGDLTNLKKSTYSYNDKNDVVSYVEFRWMLNNWYTSYQEVNQYTGDGNLEKKTIITNTNEINSENNSIVTVSSDKTTCLYNADGTLINQEEIAQKNVNGELVDCKKVCYSYNNNGNINMYYIADFLNGEWYQNYSEEYTYNNYGNLFSVVTTKSMNTLNSETGQVDSVTDSAISTEYQYDVWLQQTKIVEESGDQRKDVLSTSYDANGRIVAVTDDGKTTSYTYDEAGNISSETIGDDVKSYSYDNKGNMTSVVDANQREAKYSYDDFGNLIKHTFNKYEFEYNTLGSILKTSAANQEIVGYTYSPDVEQNVLNANYSNQQELTYQYNDDGKISSFASDSSEYFYHYYEITDDSGEIVKEERLDITDAYTGTIKRFADNKMTLFSSGEPVYSVENVSRDEDNENSFDGIVETVGNNVYTLKTEEDRDTFETNGVTDYVREYSYEDNLLTLSEVDDVMSTSYGYGSNQDILTLENHLDKFSKSYSYSYDENGNIKNETCITTTRDENGATVETTEVTQYFYDENQQLECVKNNSGMWKYYYDDRGNLSSKEEYSASIDADGKIVYTLIENSVDTYDYECSWEDKLVRYNGQEMNYDSCGNPYYYCGQFMGWTRARNLLFCDDTRFTYNEDGIRTSKITRDFDTQTDYETQFYHDGTNIIEQTDGTNTLHFRYDRNGELVGFTYNGNNYFYIKNMQKDITAVADASGNVISEYTYDPWGKVLSVTGSNTEIGNLNPFRYRSYYYDVETGFYYLQSRYYDPEVGRFINCDDVNYIGVTETVISYNPFAYCENNPVNDSDPNGTLARRFLKMFMESYVDGFISTAVLFVCLVMANGGNQYLAFHEMAQILIANLLRSQNYKVELEYQCKNDKRKEVDVFAYIRNHYYMARYIWEVKPYNQKSEANKQLKEYVKLNPGVSRGFRLSSIKRKIFNNLYISVIFDSTGGAYYYFTNNNGERITNKELKAKIKKGQYAAVGIAGAIAAVSIAILIVSKGTAAAPLKTVIKEIAKQSVATVVKDGTAVEVGAVIKIFEEVLEAA